ncbi:MAG: glycosyltransferase family 1 protein [Alphaproteobacteria bacterium]|nr:glycosyltransferase family 1 protein [Alphaproteobacteria bacterium]
MKLLIVSDAWEPQINGVVRVYQNLIREIEAMGHEVEVIGPDRFISMPMPGYSEIRLSLFAGPKLRKLMAAFKPSVVHIAVEGPLGWAARAFCIKHHIPFTTFFHTQFPDYVAARVAFSGKALTARVREAMVALVRHFHAPARYTYVTTQSIEDQLKAWGCQQPLKRLACGVDFSVFHTGPKTLFAELPKPVHLFVGRIAIEKNIAAFLDLPLEGSKVVVGQGPQLDELRARYPDVIFTGPKVGQELGDHFRSADVFVFPSLTDTFGLVIVEAMACGLPVAGYNVTGPKDIITDDTLGAVDTDLGRAVARALASGGTPQGRNAHAQKLYSWPAIAKRFVETEASAAQ